MALDCMPNDVIGFDYDYGKKMSKIKWKDESSMNGLYDEINTIVVYYVNL